MNTNWSSPKTNFLAGMLDLRQALAAGQKARLVRARNEDCQHPIRMKTSDENFRNYEFSIGYPATRDSIIAETHRSDFEKYLSLNYKTCYGTEEAMNRYYEKGLLSPDNFKGIGRSHLVKVEDMVHFLLATDDKERAEMFKQQYLTGEEANKSHFYDFYRYKHGSQWANKTFRRKLWVVELLGKDEPAPRIPALVYMLNWILYPLKYIPRRSVLRMNEYKCVTYRVGAVTNGFAIELHIPKKFSFN